MNKFGKKIITIYLSLSLALLSDRASALSVSVHSFPEFTIWSQAWVAAQAKMSADFLMIHKELAGIQTAIQGSSSLQIKSTKEAVTQQMDYSRMISNTNAVIDVKKENDISTLPSPCITGGSADGAILARDAQKSMAQKINISSVRAGPASDIDAGKLFNNYKKNYQPGSSSWNADIMVNSLLGTSNYGSSSSVKAAMDYAYNLTSVGGSSNISGDLAERSEQAKIYRMFFRGEEARSAVSKEVTSHAIADRIPIPGLGALVGDMWLKMKGGISPDSKVVTSLLGPNNKNEITNREFIETEVRRRYENPDWYWQVAAASPSNMQKEDLYMKSLSLKFQLDNLQRQERIELLLAAINEGVKVLNKPNMDILRANVR